MKIIASILTTAIFFVLSFTIGNTQETWILNFKNGDQLEVDINGFHSADKNIKYKNRETGKKEKVAAKLLKSIVFQNEGDELIFERMRMKSFKGFGKIKAHKELVWVAKLYGTDKMEGYFYIASDSSYSMGALGNMRQTSHLTSAQAIRVLPENYVFFIGLSDIEGMGGDRTARILMNRTLKKYLKTYCKDFADKMNKNSYEVTEINKLIDDYTARCK